MSRALKFSLLANFILGAIIYRQINVATGEAGASKEVPIASTSRVEELTNLGSNSNTSSSVWVRQLDWRQIESPDYPTYISNLRRVHCPEQTVRDIIKADVANLFALKRKSDVSQNASTRWSSIEEARLVAALFGEPQDLLSVNEQPSADKIDPSAPPARLPFVLQTEALASLKLTDEQRGELSELASEFIKEIGGPNQDPKDPVYVAKWQAAQSKVDQSIVRTIGRRAMVDLDAAIPSDEDDPK